MSFNGNFPDRAVKKEELNDDSINSQSPYNWGQANQLHYQSSLTYPTAPPPQFIQTFDQMRPHLSDRMDKLVAQLPDSAGEECHLPGAQGVEEGTFTTPPPEVTNQSASRLQPAVKQEFSADELDNSDTPSRRVTRSAKKREREDDSENEDDGEQKEEDAGETEDEEDLPSTRKRRRQSCNRTTESTVAPLDDTIHYDGLMDFQGNTVKPSLNAVFELAGQIDWKPQFQARNIYKRNFFSVTDAGYFMESPNTHENSGLYLRVYGVNENKRVESLSVHISAHDGDHQGQDVHLEQYPDARRLSKTKIVGSLPMFVLQPNVACCKNANLHPALTRQNDYFRPFLAPSPTGIDYANWMRVSFRRATQHNGDRRKEQGFTVLRLSLWATLADGSEAIIAVRSSEKFIITARSPAGVDPVKRKKANEKKKRAAEAAKAAQENPAQEENAESDHDDTADELQQPVLTTNRSGGPRRINSTHPARQIRIPRGSSQRGSGSASNGAGSMTPAVVGGQMINSSIAGPISQFGFGRATGYQNPAMVPASQNYGAPILPRPRGTAPGGTQTGGRSAEIPKTDTRIYAKQTARRQNTFTNNATASPAPQYHSRHGSGSSTASGQFMAFSPMSQPASFTQVGTNHVQANPSMAHNWFVQSPITSAPTQAGINAMAMDGYGQNPFEGMGNPNFAGHIPAADTAAPESLDPANVDLSIFQNNEVHQQLYTSQDLPLGFQVQPSQNHVVNAGQAQYCLNATTAENPMLPVLNDFDTMAAAMQFQNGGNQLTGTSSDLSTPANGANFDTNQNWNPFAHHDVLGQDAPELPPQAPPVEATLDHYQAFLHGDFSLTNSEGGGHDTSLEEEH